MIEFREESLRSQSGSAVGCPERVCPDSSHTSSQSTANDDDTEENSQSCDNSAVLPSNGCFSKALLSGRDELSYDASTSSLSTTDEHEAERRGKTSVIKTHFPTQSLSLFPFPSPHRQHHRPCSGAAHFPLHSDAAVQERESKGLACLKCHQQEEGDGHSLL